MLVEDTSLCFNALNGMPGPYIKWFQEKIGNTGLYNLLQAYEDKSAYALCMFAYCEVDSDPILFAGKCDGYIVKPIGSTVFGWDPIFVPIENNPNSESFAELSSDKKNIISHRYKALSLLKKHFV